MVKLTQRQQEVLGFIEGTTTTTDLKALAAVRRAQFETYQQEPAPAERGGDSPYQG